MDSFPFSPRSPMIDTPVCDSDEEVFFGPVTSKELQKASQLKRRTQFYFPSFEWKPSTLSPAEDNLTCLENRGSGSKPSAIQTTEQPDPSLSVDSLESQSFATLSDKPEDSSKGEFWSALSGNSLSTNSQPSLNDANLYSKFSEDSLETDKLLDCDNGDCNIVKSSRELSFHSNISVDSLENTEKMTNIQSLLSGWQGELEDNSEQSSGEPKDSSDASAVNQNIFCTNMTQSGSESDFYNNSLLSTPRVGANGLILKPGNVPIKTADSFTATYDILPEIENNETYSIENESSQMEGHVGPTSCNIDLPNEVPVDKDGGFLSILSEAALYHASQLKEKEHAEYQRQEESTSTAQSLEERFKTFGITAGELEEQQLSNSIMYVTGRESNILSTEMEGNTFYTGRNSGVESHIGSLGDQSYSKSIGNSAACFLSSSASTGQEASHSGGCGVENVTCESQESGTSEMRPLSVLNNPICNNTLGSAGSTFQNMADDEMSQQEVVCLDSMDCNDIQDQSSNYVRECSDISGICELNSVSENQSTGFVEGINDEESSNNDSDVSSFGGEMNDTLEEYEMMMRYGVDYILGRKGNQKKAEQPDAVESVKILQSKESENLSDRSHLPRIEKDCSSDYLSVASPTNFRGNSSSSSVEYLDAVDVSPNLKQAATSRVKENKVLSPLQRQLFKRTPQKMVPDMTPKGSTQKLLSKLPRVASVTPSKLVSPQSTRHLIRPVTPSSETKASSKHQNKPVTPGLEARSALFKKPMTPAAAVSRIPKAAVPSHHGPKPNNKVLEKIQSPVGAYIHNTPSPVLVTNVKAKSVDRPSYEKEMHARALWRAGEVKSLIQRPGGAQIANAENMNPNIGCGLPSVKYTKAPCIQLDEMSKVLVPRGGEKITKLMDAPSPQVIKHEGRVRVNCGSPKLAAKMQSMADTFDDSMIDVHSVSGDISVCVTQQACRTDTLSH